VHVVYAIPSDGADHLGTLAPAIVSDLAAADAWWRGQDGARTIRFDLADFACANELGRLDLSFARLPNPSSSYLGADRGVRIANDLTSLAPQEVKSLVYYDGAVPDPNGDFVICGTTYFQAPAAGGPFGFAFVWVQSGCPADIGQAGITATTAVHELTHNMGAVLPGAPHACPGDSGHVCDNTYDLMYPIAQPDSTLAKMVLDAGRDDYYGHSGSWFDIQDSPWLSHLPQFAVSVTADGAGTVALTAPGGSATCSPSCSTTLDNGTALRLEAQPGAGSRLVRWDGSCAGVEATCNLTMDALKNATAVFGPATYNVRVAVKGKGRVTSTPAGIACPRRCRASFTLAVALRPRAAKGYRFTGWSGACHGRGACRLSPGASRSVRATFRRR
jgi:hypothetical protein